MGKGAIVKMKIGMKQIIESKRMLYGISRVELAAAMGISVRTFESRMADPERLTLREMRAIAKKLHCSIADLAGQGTCA